MDADLVVIGGGPVGAALAMLMGRAGNRVTVLEKARFPRDKPCGEGLMPSGVAVLDRLDIDLLGAGFPPIHGVRYRLAGGSSAAGSFRSRLGCGVRRTRLDELLAERTAATPGVEMVLGCAATGVSVDGSGVRVETAAGQLKASAVVGADGLRSSVARWLGWARPPRGAGRFGLVGHLTHGRLTPPSEVVVTLLETVEVYAAPTGPDEMLLAVLGPRGALRRPGLSVADSYRQIASEAHPELTGARLTSEVRGAGPFRAGPARVAEGRAFVVGDAAGFTDPLTGDGIASGLAQAEALASFWAEDPGRPARVAARYRAWRAAQWRRRCFVSGLALGLSGSATLARRALGGLERRPAALQSLLEVNDGSRGLGSVSPRDWAALAGF
jgi:2-polyprenyl-6-methoxyphenol hydroxylase-like FAD-dependent oxidoreductase